MDSGAAGEHGREGPQAAPVSSHAASEVEAELRVLVGLLDIVPAELSDAEVHDGLLGLVHLQGRLAGAVARFADSFESRSLPSVDGARNAAAWMAARTELTRAAAGAAVAAGRGLRHCPVVDEAARRGRLGQAKVRALLAARVDVEDRFAEHEATLVDLVVDLTADQAQRVLARWRTLALEETSDEGPSPAEDEDRNQLHLSRTFQGRWRLDGDLDAVSGEGVATLLEAWIDERVHAGAIDPTDTRPRSGHRADALVALAMAGAEADVTAGQVRAQVHLSLDADELLGREVADAVELARPGCETDGGSTLSRLVAEQALCNADVAELLVRFGLDGKVEVLGTTHTRRYPTDQERAALVRRDGGCVFPGCAAPVKWCHAHHTVPYEVGHRTRLDELVLLCAHHHRAVHRGFTLARGPDGTIHVADPTGKSLTGRPAPPGGLGRGRKIPPDPETEAGRSRFAPGFARAVARPPTWGDPDDEAFDPFAVAEMDALVVRRIQALGCPDVA